MLLKGKMMKNLLPGWVEITIFIAAALLCAAIVSTLATRDLALAGLAIPLFIGAACLGLYRHGHLSAESTPSDEP
jgi:hypothetical protein